MYVTMNIFCCYAGEDEEMTRKLINYLMPLQSQGKVNIWSEVHMNVGDEWEKALHERLESADIILLLISPDFMASQYCSSVELQRAIQRHERGDARVIPILLRPTYWRDAPFAKLQMLPKDALSVGKWATSDDAFLMIARHIRRLVDAWQMQRDRNALTVDEQEFSSAENISLLGQKGRFFLRLERYIEALAAYEQALADPEESDPSLHAGKGSALFGLERYQEALVCYEEALWCSGDDPDPALYHAQGMVYEQLAQEDHAHHVRYVQLARQAYTNEEQARVHWKEEDPSGIFLIPKLTTGQTLKTLAAGEMEEDEATEEEDDGVEEEDDGVEEEEAGDKDDEEEGEEGNDTGAENEGEGSEENEGNDTYNDGVEGDSNDDYYEEGDADEVGHDGNAEEEDGEESEGDSDEEEGGEDGNGDSYEDGETGEEGDDSDGDSGTSEGDNNSDSGDAGEEGDDSDGDGGDAGEEGDDSDGDGGDAGEEGDDSDGGGDGGDD